MVLLSMKDTSFIYTDKGVLFSVRRSCVIVLTAATLVSRVTRSTTADIRFGARTVDAALTTNGCNKEKLNCNCKNSV